MNTYGCYEKLRPNDLIEAEMAKVALLVFTESGEESDREESTYSLRALCNEC